MAPAGRPAGPPAGFPNCHECPYLNAGSETTCYTCASQTIAQVASPACPTCDQILAPPRPCPNSLCASPDRYVDRIQAISYLSGPLRRTIHRYKYDDKWGWSLIFGRLLLGWLWETIDPEAMPDLIVANPTWVEPGGPHATGHTERVLEAAERGDTLGLWPFDVGTPRSIVKSHETPRSAAQGITSKRAAAQALYDALVVSHPMTVQDAHILVYDDVCTTGSQLDAVARKLKESGA